MNAPAETPGPALARSLHSFANELDYVYRTLRRHGVSALDAEDVAQEVFLIAWRRREDFDASRPLRPWLAGIAFNLAHEYHRRRPRDIVDETLPEIEIPPAAELQPEALDARALVLRVLGRLPERYREPLVLHDLGGLSVEDMAALWKLPRFTVYTRLRRARQAFADEVHKMQARSAAGVPVPAPVLAPGLLLAFERDVPPVPAAVHRRLMDRLRAEAMLASRPPPASLWMRLLGKAQDLLPVLAALALGAGAVTLVVTSRRDDRHRSASATPAPAVSARAINRAVPAGLVPTAAPGTTPARLAPAQPSALARDLIGFWRFDDGPQSSRAVDQLGAGRDCQLRQLDPGQAWVAGSTGGAIEFGLNGWLECPQPALPLRPTAALTVAAWVKRGGNPPMHRALVMRAMDEGRRNYFFFGFAGDEIMVSSSGWGGTLAIRFPEPPGRWVHVAFTHGSDHLVKLYVGGRQIAQLRSTPRRFGATQQPLRVGAGLRREPRDTVGQLFEGAVDDLLVYERALGDEEILALSRGATP